MDIEQIFFHLTYAFLLISAITRLTPFTRFLQILVILSLGSFLTLSTREGYMWQVWSSTVFLVHLFFWKNYKNVTSRYEHLELEIWNDFFHELSDDDFQLLLDSSNWRKFRFSGTISSDKEYFILICTEEAKVWQQLNYCEMHSVSKGDIILFVSREALRRANPLLERTILHLLTASRRSSMVS